MTATQIMEAEHRLIETVVQALGGTAAAIEKITSRPRQTRPPIVICSPERSHGKASPSPIIW